MKALLMREWRLTRMPSPQRGDGTARLSLRDLAAKL